MKMQEVENLFFEYEEEKHNFIQKTQQYFLKNGYQPYVWLDEEHRLRIKQKYTRKTQTFSKEKRTAFVNIAQKYAKENNLFIRFILDLGEQDTKLPKDISSQWSTELILEVKK